MSYKSENWQQKLAEVRGHIPRKEGSLEKTADEIINEEIEAELKSFFAEEPVELDEIQQKEVDALKKLSKDMQAVLKGYQKIAGMGDKELKNTKYNKDYEAVLKARDVILQLIGKVNTQKILNKEEVVVVEEKLSLEKTITKLTEKNMLGRLAKSMELNEDNKDKLFNYFDKGELKQ